MYECMCVHHVGVIVCGWVHVRVITRTYLGVCVFVHHVGVSVCMCECVTSCMCVCADV